jgi:2-polyprenyl-6-methoxyphenol hydroxylase-like FAD-dependent oxidoreductase
MSVERVDVVVVGAGPVGLLAAIELRLAGATPVVLERLVEPSRTLKAESLGTLASEALARRGMAGAIAAEEARNQQAVADFMRKAGAKSADRNTKFDGHFGGLFVIRRDAQKEPGRRPRSVRQDGLEAMLMARAQALGIEIRRQHAITGLEQDPDGVTVQWTAPAGDGDLRCSYLVGCDGGRSLIRKMAGFGFPGYDPTLTGWKANAEVDHPERLLPLGWQRTPTGLFASGPFPGRLLIIEFNGPPADRNAPVTAEEIEAALRRVSGRDVRVGAVESATRWTDNCRLVDTYRRGRVLLAGDAAHVHSPFGGQGLNLGLVEAANLGWKLGAVLRGDMPDDLLDTYTRERHPVAEAVLANTRAQVAIMRPDPQAGALRDILADAMKFDDVNRMFGEMMSGLNTRYDLGSEADEVGRLVADIPSPGDGPGAGIYALMQDGSGVLIDATTDRRASRRALDVGRLRCIGTDGRKSMLIRPDACVVWTGEGDDTGGLDAALARWFGAAELRHAA